jgi:competence protein ComEA
MQKNLLILFSIVLLCLTGCSRVSSEVELRDVESLESSNEASFVGDNATSAASSVSSVDLLEPAAVTAESETVVMVVYVCGAVNAPGVYELNAGSRINDAVKAAGGFSPNADTVYVNLAADLKDGMKLYIPTLEETSALADKDRQRASEAPMTYDIEESELQDQADSPGGLININTASKEQLMTLPGIGEKVAGRIIEYREKNGSFSKTEDIMKISGIKEKLFSKIRDKITV